MNNDFEIRIFWLIGCLYIFADGIKICKIFRIFFIISSTCIFDMIKKLYILDFIILIGRRAENKQSYKKLF